jgi:hypothetical protein
MYLPHFKTEDFLSKVQWYAPAIPAFRNLRQEDCEFEANY